MTLKVAFLVLYGITNAKDTSVAAHLEFASGNNQWNVSFARAAHDLEVDVFALFFRVLYSIRVRRESKDKLRWVSSKRGLFDVRSFYKLRTKASLRATFFAWIAVPGKILTIDNLRKRHVIW
jgi:hypothetical protein